MNYSFWEKNILETSTDITIIGSGIVGLSAAISIKESNPSMGVKIIERGSLPYGASTKNAGFSCFGSVSELLDDIAIMGEKSCMDVVNMRWEGLKKLKNRVGEQTLSYQACGGTELFRHADQELKENCIKQIAYCNSLLEQAIGVQNCFGVQMNHSLSGFDQVSIFNQYEGSINPMAMMMSLHRQAIQLGIQIWYGIDIKAIEQTNKTLLTITGLHIAYDQLVVCTNGFTKHLLPHLDVVPARNQVLITSPLKDLPLDSTYHVDKGYLYFRQFENRILLGGGRNIASNAENTDIFGQTEEIKAYLTSFLDTIVPGASAHIAHWWSGILGVGESKYPICEWVGEDILVGVRLGGMGVAIGSHLGDMLCQALVSRGIIKNAI